jgi:hypothetical protein
MESLEKVAEAAFGKAIRKWADERKIKLEYVKFTGSMGWPDRIVLWQGGHLIWIEWKRKGEKPRPLQAHIHQLLRSMGHDVRVYDDWHVALSEVQAEVAATI